MSAPPEDQLAAARGIVYALPLGLLAWALVGGLIALAVLL